MYQNKMSERIEIKERLGPVIRMGLYPYDSCYTNCIVILHYRTQIFYQKFSLENFLPEVVTNNCSIVVLINN